MKRIRCYILKCLGFVSFIVLCANTLQAQLITTVAGSNILGPGFSGNGGPATSAQLNSPFGVTIDGNGNLCIADQANSLIRKVDISGKITTYAGDYTYGAGYYGDGGPATLAEMDYPYGITFDKKGNLYIADGYNNVIREVSTTGTITTVAGNYGLGYGYSGDGGLATSAQLNQPTGVAFDTTGNMYIADMGNNVIRVVYKNGKINTYAGNPSLGGGYSGDGGAAANAQFYFPYSVACDNAGNLYIADIDNHVIRKINSKGIISTVAGNHTKGFGYSGDGGPAKSAQLNFPISVAIDSLGDLFIADQSNNVIRMVSTSGVISTVAGNFSAGAGYSGDGGLATSAQLSHPSGLIYTSGSLYFSDQNNNVVRRVTGIVGINPISEEHNAIDFYPNPSNGIFNCQVDVMNKNLAYTLEIYDMIGERVQVLPIVTSHFSVNLTNCSPAVYFYRLISNNGESVNCGRLIVQ